MPSPALALLAVLPQALAAPQGTSYPRDPVRPARPLEYVLSTAGMSALQLDGGGTELELADTNGDGHLDLVTIGDHGSPFVNTNQHGITTFFGDGRGGWTLFQNGNFGYGGIAAGDVNGDGLLDLAYGMHHDYSADDFGDQLLEVALGDGTGLAWLPWDDGLATNGETWGMFATDLADVDGDGRLDVLSNSFGCCAGAHVYLNGGDGTWSQSFGFLGGNAQPFAAFADFDADGAPDFVVANSMGAVWRGDGLGGFTALEAGLPGTRNGVAVGDVDGDGGDELAFVGPGGRLEVWKLGPGATWASLASGLPESSPFQRVQVADMDADGHRDVVGYGGGKLGVYRGDGAGGFVLAGGFSLPAGSPQAFRVGGDVDHNGRPDLVMVQEEGCGLFCSRNRLYCYREVSVPARLEAFLVHPRGGQTWRAGSAQAVRWSAGVPGRVAATADLELSTSGPGGPWTLLAAGVPNDGEHQLLVPATPSDDAWIRVTVRTARALSRATGARPLRIVP